MFGSTCNNVLDVAKVKFCCIQFQERMFQFEKRTSLHVLKKLYQKGLELLQRVLIQTFYSSLWIDTSVTSGTVRQAFENVENRFHNFNKLLKQIIRKRNTRTFVYYSGTFFCLINRKNVINICLILELTWWFNLSLMNLVKKHQYSILILDECTNYDHL